MKVGFIGGGNIAEAIISGMLKSNIFSKKDIIINDINKKRLIFLENKFEIKRSKNDFFKKIEVIIICVKPKILFELLENIKDFINEKHIIISVVAGVNLEKICKKLSTGQVVRAMPNTSSEIGEGITVLYKKENILDKNQIKNIEKIFSSVGDFLWLKEEYFDMAGVLSGSGPAYIYRFIEALTDGAVSLGLPREIANELILKTIIGSVKNLKEKKVIPRILSNKVASPGGTTISALNSMEKNGFSSSIYKGLKKAYLRSIELSKYIE